VINDFINTAALIDSISHDENIITEVISKGENLIQSKEYDLALKCFVEGFSHEKWRN